MRLMDSKMHGGVCMLRKVASGCVPRHGAILNVQTYASGCAAAGALPETIFLPLGRLSGQVGRL